MIFPQFKDVKPQDVRKTETSNLELLLQLGEEILNEPVLKGPRDYLKARKNYENKASKISYDSGDIESFILANTDKAYTEQQWEKLGIFTGALVSALTQKQAQTTINIDLGNKTFHYLFGWMCHANNIIVKNLTGKYAFWRTGSDEGFVGSITGINITGYHSFCWAGSDKGRVESITGINITGNNAFEFAGSYEGSVGKSIGIQVQGNGAFFGVGSGNGNVGVVRHYDIKGANLFVAANISKRVLLTQEQAEKYIGLVKEIETAGKNSDEIQKMIEQLNLLWGKE